MRKVIFLSVPLLIFGFGVFTDPAYKKIKTATEAFVVDTLAMGLTVPWASTFLNNPGLFIYRTKWTKCG